MAKHYVFCGTINLTKTRPPPEVVEKFKSGMTKLAFDAKNPAYIKGQLECGAEGRYHFQFGIKLSLRRTLGPLRKHIRKQTTYNMVKDALTAARNPEATMDYGKKEKSRVEGPWEFGVPQQVRNSGKRKAEESAGAQFIKKAKLCVEHKVDPRVLFRASPEIFINNERGKAKYLERLTPQRDNQPVSLVMLAGESNAGKSSVIKLICDYVGSSDVYHVPAPYAAGKQRWLSDYQGESVIFFDEFEPSDIAPASLKLMCRGGPCQVPSGAGGATSKITAHTIFIASNHLLDDFQRDRGWNRESVRAMKNRLDAPQSYYGLPLNRELHPLGKASKKIISKPSKWRLKTRKTILVE